MPSILSYQSEPLNVISPNSDVGGAHHCAVVIWFYTYSLQVVFVLRYALECNNQFRPATIYGRARTGCFTSCPIDVAACMVGVVTRLSWPSFFWNKINSALSAVEYHVMYHVSCLLINAGSVTFGRL